MAKVKRIEDSLNKLLDLIKLPQKKDQNQN